MGRKHLENILAAFLLLALLPLPSCQKEGGDDGGGVKPIPAEWTVSGTVLGDDGKPIAGAVVSDGRSCVKTDEKGYYALPVDLSGNLEETLQYVFVSTPSGWAAPMTEKGPVFWQWLKDYQKDQDGKITDVDFTLNKIAKPERFTLFIFGDPQPRPSNTGWTDGYGYHSVDVCEDMYRDMKEYAAALSDRPVYGIGLGDIVHRYPKYYSTYREKMAAAGVVCYNVIGNHDQVSDMNGTDPTGMTDEASSKIYEQEMGPTNYSFNLGKLHFLMLDNMIIQSGGKSDECETGLTDAIWEFAQNDLREVPSDYAIMLCAHSPMFRMLGGGTRSGLHLKELRRELQRFHRVYAWAGHTHCSFNYYEEGSNLEVHTLGRVTGTLWTNEYQSENGTPRGYMVFDYDGLEHISWKFKPIFWQKAAHVRASTPADIPDYAFRDWDYDDSGRAVLKSGGNLTDDYQMQVFAPGTYDSNDKTVYANIFLYDEAWDTPYFQVKGSAAWAPMTRITEDNWKLYQHSWADRVLRHFYAMKWSSLRKEWYGTDYTGTEYPDEKKTNCATMFRYTLSTTAPHGSGTVKVTDRFGNEYRGSVKW